MIQEQAHEAENSHMQAVLSYPAWTYFLHFQLVALPGSGVTFLYFQDDKFRFVEKYIHFLG